MKELRVDSTEQLITELNSLPNHFFYRGHPDADWKLQSSLERVIGTRWSAEFATKVEERSLDIFMTKFHLYDHENIQPSSKLSWLSLMQHYGVPTRLLDFTESPYLALYFALESYRPETKKDFAVIAIDYTAIMQKSIEEISRRQTGFNETRQSAYKNQDRVFDEIVDKYSHDIAWVAEPRQFNKRLDRQAGSFLLSGNRGRKIQETLTLPIYADVSMTKYRISYGLYQSTFALLRKMNLTSKSLYGDLGGLASSIRMELQVYSFSELEERS